MRGDERHIVVSKRFSLDAQHGRAREDEARHSNPNRGSGAGVAGGKGRSAGGVWLGI
ncbi:hypothetical protein AZ78_0777 [Lysobacter capsici AZ78]|uniref:Uncharacterized protein n=1 Tax=Lysobacter capsici AZ78 TaxID=1444315 RepID=A0A120AFM8_9GAMM|nr:hypothetical protein AZ78_0777 [Lysobacter capsici AZ78]